MTQHYLPVHKKESRNFSKIWYKKVHATTCISMHRRPKQWWSTDKTIFQCKWTMKENHWSKCTTLNSWDHASRQMEIAQKKLKDACIALARQKAVVMASIWKDRNIKTATKVKVMKSMVWAVFQYGVEGWTSKKSVRNRI